MVKNFDKLTTQTNTDVCLTNETNHTILKMSKINIFSSDRLDGNHLHNNHLLTCPLNKFQLFHQIKFDSRWRLVHSRHAEGCEATLEIFPVKDLFNRLKKGRAIAIFNRYYNLM